MAGTACAKHAASMRVWNLNMFREVCLKNVSDGSDTAASCGSVTLLWVSASSSLSALGFASSRVSLVSKLLHIKA